MVASSCPNCKYKAQVRWSFGSNKRSCIELADRGSAAATLTTLPTGAFQPNAVVLVDVSVDYRPIFQNGFNIGGFDLAALNGTLKQTFTAETWQTVRNWRGASPFPGLSGVNAGIWTGTLCP